MAPSASNVTSLEGPSSSSAAGSALPILSLLGWRGGLGAPAHSERRSGRILCERRVRRRSPTTVAEQQTPSPLSPTPSRYIHNYAFKKRVRWSVNREWIMRSRREKKQKAGCVFQATRKEKNSDPPPNPCSTQKQPDKSTITPKTIIANNRETGNKGVETQGLPPKRRILGAMRFCLRIMRGRIIMLQSGQLSSFDSQSWCCIRTREGGFL
jgi:hypothetical protein